MIIGLGIDIIEVERVRKVLEKHLDGLRRRVFLEEELKTCFKHLDPAPHLAARFAAKEATMKALGTGWAQGIGFQHIEIYKNSEGKPLLRLHGAAQKKATQMGVKQIYLSYSHTDNYANAVVIFETSF